MTSYDTEELWNCQDYFPMASVAILLPGHFECYVKTCHECQIHVTNKLHIPVTISAPATLFTKVYLEIMLMPKAQGYHYIIAA